MSDSGIRLFGTAVDSIVDGPGLRYAVFTQGCPHFCHGCHNPASQAFDGGFSKPVEELVKEIVANKLIRGVTLSGGEPLAQSGACLDLALRVKELGYNLWMFTGYVFEEVLAGKIGQAATELLALCDVVVDGPYVDTLGSYELVWKGSSNQRVIDVAQSLALGKVVLWEQANDFSLQPPSRW